MCSLKKAMMMLVVALTMTSGLWAQRPGHGGMGGMFGNLPSMPGLSNPTVGSGSEYLMTAKGKEMDIAMVALGKEDVDGNPGYWMEMRMTSADTGGGEMVMKTLMVTTGSQAGMRRMIMQQPGKPPMEIDGMFMSMMQQHQPHPAAPSAPGGGDRGELVGTESVTVPAGTFNCQHYRSKSASGTTDMWISTDVTPYAMVKMTNADTTMVLKKVLTDEKTHINGEPQKMQMPQMPHF
jgi:hypothetical protein